MPEHPAAVAVPEVRVRAFVDFWNFQLLLDAWRAHFRLDWSRFGPWLAGQAGAVYLARGQPGRVRYEGLHVYLSHNPAASRDDGLRHWAGEVLSRFPGVHVVLKERRPKEPPRCHACFQAIDSCPVPGCGGSVRGTIEKGIDTAIVTDMIRLAWEDAWELAVLVSADADFVPAVDLLNRKGRKVIHAGFPPKGVDLARHCWAAFDLTEQLQEVERPAT
jgi:uncharacterized LabA/DUF88 family protein